MNKVLWLPSWYPSRMSVQNGDFIYRHARCVTDLVELKLLYVIGLTGDEQSRPTKINNNSDAEYEESIVLYNRFRCGRFTKLFSFIKYFYLNLRNIKTIIKDNNGPDLIHVHVAFRAGLVALWVKWKYGIPYVLSEHWTIFTKERVDNYSRRNIIFRHFIRKVISNSSALTVVSNSLGEGIQKMVIQKPFIKIPNVVDVDVFNYEPVGNKKEFVFIHVSGMKGIKNPKGIINAFAKLTEIEKDIKLVMVGDVPETVISYAKNMGFDNDQIVFTGILEYGAVAAEMKAANAFALFSHSETQSCVTIEALCCGLPVIASRLPCIEELIDDQNGILVPPGDEGALFNAMERMLNEAEHYDHKAIADKAQSLYNPSVVGQQFNAVYEKVLSERRDYK